jgi:hypothetical protein
MPPPFVAPPPVSPPNRTAPPTSIRDLFGNRDWSPETDFQATLCKLKGDIPFNWFYSMVDFFK